MISGLNTGFHLVLGFTFCRLWATVYTFQHESLVKVVYELSGEIILRKESKVREGWKKQRAHTSRYCRCLSSQWYWSILMLHQIPNRIYLSMSKPQVMIYLCARHLKSEVSKKIHSVDSRLLAGVMSRRYCFLHFSVE